jgi:hypothetical protein
MSYDDLYTQTLTGDNVNFSNTVQSPADGYRAYANTVGSGLQRLISNDVYINSNLARLPGQSTTTYKISLDMNGLYDTDMWRCYSIDIPDTTDHVPTMKQINATATTLPLTLKIPHLPNGTKITAVTVRCFNISPSSLPATKASVSFRSRHPTSHDSSTYYITKQVDPSTTISDYQYPHLIALTTNVEVNNLYEYYVDLFGDSFGSGLAYMNVFITTAKI